MSLLLNACFEKSGVCAPDPLPVSNGMSLSLNHVVAYDAQGRPVSRAGDFKWDLSAYTSYGRKCIVYFDYWNNVGGPKSFDILECTDARVARIRELQHLMCCRMYPMDGNVLDARGVVTAFFILRRVARFAEQHNLSVRHIFEKSVWLDAFIAEIPDSECDRFKIWLNFLDRLDSDSMLGFHVAKSSRRSQLKERASRYRDSYKQHAPLPTRIYSGLISSLATELDDIEAHRDGLLNLLRDAIHAHREVRRISPDARTIGIGADLFSKHGVEQFFKKRNYRCYTDGLSGVIGEIFQVCILQILTFSGMRQSEARTLPFECMEVESRNGRRHALFVGATTKFNGGRRMRTKWVTTDGDGFRAARLAREFSAAIYESMGVSPSGKETSKDSFPLFVSNDYLPWGRVLKGGAGTTQFRAFFPPFTNERDEFKSRLFPTIGAEDIAELEDIDPFRAWTDEREFAVGCRWPLTSHQLRRSLALYARASGCVRLSSLRRQLQHITNDMSVYYSNGCAFARNFLADDPVEFRKHVALEWQDAAVEAQVLAMVWDVLGAAEPLHGGAGVYYEQRRKSGSLMSREQVEKAIRAGTLGYKAHPLGACIKVGPCEKKMGLDFIEVACASENCKNLIGKHSRIIQVIKAKRGMLACIDKTTLTYKFEMEELHELEKVEARWRPSTDLVAASTRKTYG